jgi:hypothetical protein
MPLIDISWRVENLDKVISDLSKIPGGAAFAVSHAIMDTLRAVRTQAARSARERYNIPYGWVLKAFGTPRVMGMYGLLRSTGARAPLHLFPHSDQRPSGVQVQEVKGSTMLIRHAFREAVVGRGSGYTGYRGAPRYPTHAIVGRAAPQMIDEQSTVWPKIEAFERSKLQERLAHYIGAILGGDIKV